MEMFSKRGKQYSCKSARSQKSCGANASCISLSSHLISEECMKLDRNQVTILRGSQNVSDIRGHDEGCRTWSERGRTYWRVHPAEISRTLILACSWAIIYSELTGRAGVELPTLNEVERGGERGKEETPCMQYVFQSDDGVRRHQLQPGVFAEEQKPNKTDKIVALPMFLLCFDVRKCWESASWAASNANSDSHADCTIAAIWIYHVAVATSRVEAALDFA